MAATTPLLTPWPAPVSSPAAPVAELLPDQPGAAPALSSPAPAATAAAPSRFEGIAAPPPEPPRRRGVTRYTIGPDDVLWQVAERFGLRSETILWANEINDPDLLLVGQELTIPPRDGVLYTVQPGDRLAEVATRYGVELAGVIDASGLANPDQVQAGADVFLPGARPLRAAVARGLPAQVLWAAEAQPLEALAALAPLPPNIESLLGAGWLRAERETALFKSAARDAAPLHDLPSGARLERLEGFQAGRIQVRDAGDGRTRQAMTGWVEAAVLAVGTAPPALPRAYPANTAMDIAHVFVPYRSQLDGAAYAEANCGPTTIGMALEAFGVAVSSRQLRTETLDAQRMWGNNVGTLITALASVVERHGLRALDLHADGGAVRRWTTDDIRAHVGQGHPVVVQARYRSLPGRGRAPFYGDHYIVVTGVVGDSFLYNDSVDSDGLGWDRLIPAEGLRAAMDASDRRYAYAAFAVARH